MTIKLCDTVSELINLIQTESAGVVAETLDFWLHECSLDEAPSIEEVTQWRDLLNARGGKFLKIAAACQNWLDQEHH